TGLLFRDPLCTESPLRPRKLSNALGFDVEPRVSTAKLSRHKLETWTVLSYGAASQLNTNQIRCIGLDPDHKVLGVSATLRRLNGSTHLLRARTLGCGTLVTQADSANHLYQLYSHPQKRWRLSTWAAAGVAAMVVMTGLQIGAHPCKATKAEMQLQSLEEEQAREIRHYVAWNSKQASPSFTAAADEEDDSPIQSRIEALRAKAARLQSEQENTVAIAAELERLQKEISRRDAIISDLQGARKDLQQLLKELNPNGKFASAEEEGAWLRTQVLTLKKELNERNAAVDELNTARNTLQQELANIKSAAVKLQDQFELTQVEKESLEQRLTRLNALREQEMEEQSGTLSALEQDYSKRLTELKAQLNNTQQALQDANRDITAKETEIAQLAETRTKLSQDLATSQHKLRLFEDGL
ncbi:MAG: hypothetical protein KDK78_12300, partial [Chlamydiia bacterium]|nr:hypothetical protein [Chlamydiia bacterium]